jgi:hypothetical protein
MAIVYLVCCVAAEVLLGLLARTSAAAEKDKIRIKALLILPHPPPGSVLCVRPMFQPAALIACPFFSLKKQEKNA